MNSDGSDVRQLTDTFFASRCPTWSSDGSKIAYLHLVSTIFAIFVMNPDGSGKAQVTPAANVMGCPIAWSPDDSRFAWAAWDVDSWNEVFVINADGTGLTNISNNPNQPDDDPAWSPDGRRIAFFSSRGGVFGIYTMNPDGTGVQPLIVGPGSNAYPSWSPDGRRLVFVSTRDGSRDLYIANLDGTGALRLTNDTLEERHPRWRPSP
jgi:TolB protein